MGPRLAGRDPVRPHLPAVRPLLLPDQPAPDPGVIQPGGGVCGPHGHRDGGGPVLRHWHHLPDHGGTRRKRHRGGSSAPGHRGRQGERPPQRLGGQDPFPVRRRLPAGPPAGAGGHHPRRHRGGPAPEGVGPRRGGHHRPHGAAPGGVCIL